MSGKHGGPIQTQQVQDAVGRLTQEERLALLVLYRKAGLKLPGGPVPAEVVAEARRLARKNPKTGERRSLRQIAAELAVLGHMAPSGQPYNPNTIRQMLAKGTCQRSG